MKIKLSTVALIVAAVVATAVLGVMYLQQQSEQQLLSSELTAAKELLREYGSADNLEEQLADAEARLMIEQAYFPDKLSSEAILNSVLQLARESQVNVVAVMTQPGREEQRGNYTYFALSIHLEVTGSLPELQAFISKLEKGALKAVSIDDLSIAGIKDSPAASLRFSVHARR